MARARKNGVKKMKLLSIVMNLIAKRRAIRKAKRRAKRIFRFVKLVVLFCICAPLIRKVLK